MSKNANNVKLGVCDVEVDGVDVGHTKGGVEVVYEPTFQDIMVDKYGDTVVEKKLVAEKFTAKVPFAEKTIANLKKAMPLSQFQGAADARVHLGSNSGKSAGDQAVQLVLHPQNEGTRAFDVVFHKAVVTSEVPINHNTEGATIVEVTFEALVDESKSDNNYLGFIGDSTQ